VAEAHVRTEDATGGGYSDTSDGCGYYVEQFLVRESIDSSEISKLHQLLAERQGGRTCVPSVGNILTEMLQRHAISFLLYPLLTFAIDDLYGMMTKGNGFSEYVSQGAPKPSH
jgi:hypothetical protein